MKKLDQITAFITQLNLVAAEQIDTFVEDPKIVPCGKNLGHDGIILFRQTYTGVISIENFPHAKHAPELLFAHVCAWLMDNNPSDEDDEIAQPSTDVDVIDDKRADVEISIEFSENITVVKDPAGTIRFNAKIWRLDDVTTDYAQEGEVNRASN